MIKLNHCINKLPPSKFEELCILLNNDDSWIEIAVKIHTRDNLNFRFSNDDIENFRRDQNSAKQMLNTWSTDNAKIQDLIKICKDLHFERFVDFLIDCVEPVEKSIKDYHISFSLLQEWTNDFSKSKLIGTGGFSNVYKAFDNFSKKTYAVKKMSDINNFSKNQLSNELSVMAKCKHDNLIKIIAYSIENDINCIVYEYAVNGSLDYQILNAKERLNCVQRINILKDTTNGLIYLHSKNFIHRDVKSPNILLDALYTAKLCDYGLARFSLSMDTKTNLIGGTNIYIPPEVYYDEGKISAKTDVYGFGVVILEILTGLRAYDEDRTEFSIINHIKKTCNSQIKICKDNNVKDWSDNALELLFKLAIDCLDTRYLNRPTMEYILNILSTI